MPDEISISEAISIAKNLGSHFKAFKKLEDVLKIVPTAERRAKTADEQYEITKKRLEALKIEESRVLGSISSAGSTIKENIKKIGDALTKAKREAKEDLERAGRETREAISGIEQKSGEVKASFLKDKTSKTDELQSLNRLIDDAKQRVEELKRRFA